MATEPNKLIFQESPDFYLGTNKFVNVPVIVQYADTPLIEIGQFESAGFTTQISIYHPDGTYLAKAKGTQLYCTEAGRKAGVEMRYPAGMTVCEIRGKTIFEIRRETAAALKGSAELYTPTGRFIKVSEDVTIGNLLYPNRPLAYEIGSAMVILDNFEIRDSSIGIHYVDNNNMIIGVDGKVFQSQSDTDFNALYPDIPILVPTVKTPREMQQGSQNIEISFGVPSFKPVFDWIAAKIDQVLTEIEKQREPFALAAMYDVDDIRGTCRLLFASSWLDQDPHIGLEYIKEKLRNGLPADKLRAFVDCRYLKMEDPVAFGNRLKFSGYVSSPPYRVVGKNCLSLEHDVCYFFRCEPLTRNDGTEPER